jgi:ParB-like chromosome segregation protein Spo0J
MTAREVHPVADLFPMLADDELAELAEDIRQRGLLQPIVLDADGRVLDGRNRLAACELAGVTPDFVGYHGDDPGGYALAVNVQRRNLTKGQRAMLIVESGLSTEYTDTGDSAKISKQYISRARIVKKYAPVLVDAIICGADQLNRAYEFAQQEKTKSEGFEAQLAKLRVEDPELAAKVVEGDLTLAGARAELAERERKRAEERRDARALLTRAVDLLSPPTAGNGFVASWADHLGELDTELSDLITRAEQAAQVLLDLIERKSR